MPNRVIAFDETVPHTKLIFPGGEVHVRIDFEKMLFPAHKFTIESLPTNSEEVMELLLLTDAIRREFPAVIINLALQYFPYARQDRVCYPGEALSAAVMAKIINACDFDVVGLIDPHSDVTPALVERSVMFPLKEILQRIVNNNMVLVAPDAGALKRVSALGQDFNLPVVFATKHRDPKTGDLTKPHVETAHIDNKDFLIVDDICDGGRTFTALAKCLKPFTNGRVLLYVTHGIFSRGLDVFNDCIDKIYAVNIWPDVTETPILQKVEGII